MDLARRLRQSEGARCGHSDDQVSAPTEVELNTVALSEFPRVASHLTDTHSGWEFHSVVSAELEERVSNSRAMGVEPRGWLTDRATLMLRVLDLTSVGRHRCPLRSG
ncbi:hypothetical protein GW17_00006159 [Ensete ventricosum]|nr:hypothetical protein GW17_00006159 [Ensete ventricosum]